MAGVYKLPFYLPPEQSDTIDSKMLKALMIALKTHNSQSDLKYLLFYKISRTPDFEFYGRIFVNL